MLIVIPAAGTSSRMRGRDKLLEPVDDQPLLARQVGIALESGAEVLVTMSPDKPDRLAVVDRIVDDRLTVVTVPEAGEGMAASIRAGVDHAHARKASALMIMLADMPEIKADDLLTMLRMFDGEKVLRATDADGQLGHPVIFPPRLYPALVALSGDQGARAVLSGEDVLTIALPGYRATTDLDTPEEWAEWRERHGR